MPLPFLGNKFSPKKGPPRKSASLSNLNLDADKRVSEFGLDIGPIKAKLGDYVLELQDDGEWALGNKAFMNYIDLHDSARCWHLQVDSFGARQNVV